MKFFKILFIGAAFSLVAISTFAQQVAPARHGFISVDSRYPGLPVFVDGAEAGFTPLRNWSLTPGEHEIAVKRAQPESWLDFDWVEICSLSAGDTLHFVARFLKGYSINSTPFGAEVYVDGVLEGATPLVLRLPEDEIASVEIRKAGYQAEQMQIGKTKEGLAETRLYAVALKPEKDLTILHDVGTSRRRFHLARNRRISLAAAGLSLASGVAAILLKDKADHFYDRYLTASLPAQREKFYARTEDYDRYSGIATGVFEASFAVSFYFFLKSTSQ
jgi:hypothetical protein